MNSSFADMTEDARSVAGNPSKVAKLVETVFSMVSSTKYGGQLLEMKHKLLALARMLKRYSRKEYLDVPWQTIVMITAALIYFVSPIDAIADFLPMIGFTDDAAVILAIWAAVSGDVDRFLAWESVRENTPFEEIGPC